MIANRRLTAAFFNTSIEYIESVLQTPMIEEFIFTFIFIDIIHKHFTFIAHHDDNPPTAIPPINAKPYEYLESGLNSGITIS